MATTLDRDGGAARRRRDFCLLADVQSCPCDCDAGGQEWAAADLWRSAPPLDRGPSTQGFRWTGHLFQGRFGAVVMDEPHLLAAARHIARNPVVAGLVSRAGTGHGRASARISRARMTSSQRGAAVRADPDYASLLAGPADLATTARIAPAPTICRPLGAPEWIAALERRLRPSHRANPDQSRDWTISPSGSNGCCRFK